MEYLRVRYSSLVGSGFFEMLKEVKTTTAFIVTVKANKIRGMILYHHPKDLLTFAELGVGMSVTYGTITRMELMQKALLPNRHRNFFDFMRKTLGKNKHRLSKHVFEIIYNVDFDQPNIPSWN